MPPRKGRNGKRAQDLEQIDDNSSILSSLPPDLSFDEPSSSSPSPPPPLLSPQRPPSPSRTLLLFDDEPPGSSVLTARMPSTVDYGFSEEVMEAPTMAGESIGPAQSAVRSPVLST